MALVLISPNMFLPVPVVGQQIGPQWATDINNCLSVIDGHDHTNGSGLKVPTGGLDINSNLSFQNNSATVVKSVNFNPQAASLTDTIALYSIAGDLFYNDNVGNVIRVTQSGSIVGPSGSITGLVSPASATYIAGSQTFVWQGDVNVAATMDMGSIILRNLTASSFGLTLLPPTLSVDYSLTLPRLPTELSFMTLDITGAMDTWKLDPVSLQVNASTVSVRNVIWERVFLANGFYAVDSAVDGGTVVPYNAEIINAYAISDGVGTSGTTELDIQIQTAPLGAWTSIFAVTPKFTSTSATGAYTQVLPTPPAQTGVTAPTLAVTTIAAGSRIRMNIVQAMASGANASVGIQLKVAA